MAFINATLSDRVAYGFKAAPGWKTEITAMDNGLEYRDGKWMYPKHRYSAQYQSFKEAERMALIQAFHACRGRLHCFKFKDWADPEAEDEPLSPEVGTTDPVQLIKTYTFGDQTSTRLVQATDDTAVVYEDGTPVAGTLDTETGLFTPDSNWGSGEHTWTGPVLVWVRFDSDSNAFSIDEWDAATTDIELIEVRRPAA